MRIIRKLRVLQLIKLIAGAIAMTMTIAGLAVAAPMQSDAAFAFDETGACVREVHANSPGLSNHGVLDCVGRAAAACMMIPGGDTTVGMMECLGGELEYWDARLDAAYAERIGIARTQDAEMLESGSPVVSIEESLRAMQQAWMSFRDASCRYEQAQWRGGTGGVPATMACHLHETARQALKLEGWWEQ